MKRLVTLLTLVGFFSIAYSQNTKQSVAKPSTFIENAGQLNDNSIKFYSANNTILIHNDKIAIGETEITFKAANSTHPIGTNKNQRILNFFGKAQSINHIANYQQVKYKNLWHGIDLAFTTLKNGEVEFQFFIAPKANPDDIQLEITGSNITLDETEKGLTITQDGTPLYNISGLKAFQGTHEIAISPIVKTRAEDAYSLAYSVENYNPEYALVIDPVLVTILASGGTDYAYEVAAATNGDIYVVGQTGTTSDFVTPTHTHGGSTGGSDAYVSRFDSDMNLLATTIISSSGSDESLGLTIDTSNGNVFVCGTTKNAADFSVNPITWGTPAINERNGFVAKLNPGLDTLYATTIICSNEKDEAHSVLVGYNSDVFVTGQVGHRGTFACNGCPEKVSKGDSNGNVEAFITKMSNDLSTHMKTVILTSDAEDESYVVKADQNNQIFIAGRTKNYDDFADNKEYYGGSPNIKVGYSAFVARFNYNLGLQKTGILASEIVSDVIRTLLIDNNGNIYVAGLTEDANTFPKSPKYYYGNSFTPDAFVVRLNNSLNNHGATAILCSSDKDKAYGLCMDANQNIVIAGYSMNPTNFGQNQNHNGHIGDEDGFVITLTNDLSSHISTDIYSSDGIDIIYDIAYTADGGMVVVGDTDDSPNLTDDPNTVLGNSAGTDAFVIKIGGTITQSPTEEADKNSASINGNELLINLSEAGYIGYEIYSLDGKLMDMHSKGFMPQGQYRYTLSENNVSGIYLVNVRLGDEMIGLKAFD